MESEHPSCWAIRRKVSTAAIRRVTVSRSARVKCRLDRGRRCGAINCWWTAHVALILASDKKADSSHLTIDPLATTLKVTASGLRRALLAVLVLTYRYLYDDSVAMISCACCGFVRSFKLFSTRACSRAEELCCC